MDTGIQKIVYLVNYKLGCLPLFKATPPPPQTNTYGSVEYAPLGPSCPHSVGKFCGLQGAGEVRGAF